MGRGAIRKRKTAKSEHWKEKIRAQTHTRLEPHVQINENKIVQPLLKQQKALTYTQLWKESGLTKRPFNKYLHGLIEKGIIIKIRGKGKRSAYCLELRVVPKTARFQVTSITILHQSIVNDPINLFNRRLGSFVTYVLKRYDLVQAMVILSPIISQVSAYINLPKTVGGELVLVPRPSVEKSVDWQTWKNLDSYDTSG